MCSSASKPVRISTFVAGHQVKLVLFPVGLERLLTFLVWPPQAIL
jgi:hypothetical protein